MSVHPRLRTRWCLTPIRAGLAALGMAVVPGTALVDRHADGSLTANPGSPFTAGGSGLGTGLGSQARS
jgi:hypothetical protein